MMGLEGSKPGISQINQQRTLYLLRTGGPLSRADIARQTRLTKATISKIVNDLEEANLIRKVGMGVQGRGRPAMLYEFNPASGLAVGVEIKQEACEAVVTYLDANPLGSFRQILPDTQPETVVTALERILAEVRSEFRNPLVGMGIGVPGVCDGKREKVVLSERLEWKDVELVNMLQRRVELDVFVENRANAAALGEKWYGVGKDADHFLFVHIGSGIKAGIILNGELYIGWNGAAGEIGHMTIVPNGPVCVCGRRGCLEALASTHAIQDYVKSLLQAGQAPGFQQRLGAGERFDIDDLFEAAAEGDETIIGVFRDSARYIGIALAIIANTFNPQKIVLGDFANHAPPVFLETVRTTAYEHTFEVPWRGLEIIPSQLGREAVAIGAAALILSKDFQRLQAQAIATAA